MAPAERPLPAANAVAPRRAAFAFIFVTVCLDMLALGVMIPVLPRLIVQLERGDVAEAAWITGVFGFAWAAMQFFFSPVLGALSDRFGRRPIVLLSNFGMGADYVLMALAPSLSWLFVGRLVSGITSASFPIASAYIADVTPPEQRAEKFGMLGAAFGLGFIVGPGLGGVLGGIDLRLPFWVSAGLSLANAVYGFFVLPESLAREQRAKVGWRVSNPFGSLRMLLADRLLVGLTLSSFLSYLAHESLPSVFVLYTTARYAWGERVIGMVLAAVGLFSALVSALLVGKSVARFGTRKTAAFGLLWGAGGFAIYGVASTGWGFMAGVPLMALWGLSEPAVQALMSDRIGASAQGQLQGALTSLRGITGMIGPLLFAKVFALALRDRDPNLLGVGLGAPYVLAALLAVASLVTVLLMARDGDVAEAKVPGLE